MKYIWVLIFIIVVIITIVLLIVYPPVKNRTFHMSHKDGGIFSQINNMIGATQYVKQHEGSSIKYEHFDFLQNSHIHFKPKSKPMFPLNRAFRNIKIGPIPLYRQFGSILYGNQREVFPCKPATPFTELKSIINDYFIFTDVFETKAQEFWKQHNVSQDDFVIGIHYRGTDTIDHWPYKLSNPDLYFRKCKEIQQKHPNAKILVATDDVSFWEKSQRVFGDQCLSQDNVPRSDIAIHLNPNVSKDQVINTVIIDAILLSRSNHLIKGRSNVSEYSFMRKPEMACTVIFSEEHTYNKLSGISEKFVV